ncbi:MAG TPA: YceK/YidQ family lipoprotein [Kiritimatiellia bacterium]|nr:YceK/YidQ family lipoprotein [Kiritimatiellia bacterium]HNR93499.1 YceK/YidQ family lipoprotein [Kiritimatiellia bacterium]HNS81003.1 YceK/YidQ family lipoprotein [Kiritimatiellia bacterium]HPA78001.1 YceK/YidQ family lipoprotein [Kiritimatiellia bacterium]HQQ04690.1 YceK/YidQ family lipoprotein [Kiritimatiellia bacterium]
MKKALCFILLSLFTGCSSLITQFGTDKDDMYECGPPVKVKQIYSGTACNILHAKAVINGTTGMDDPGRAIEVCIFPFYYVFEFPLSLVMDTVLLPMTICKQIIYGDLTID